MAILKSFRLYLLIIPALAVLGWSVVTDPDAGLETMARLEWLSWVFVFGALAYLLRRALLDGARSSAAYSKAMQTPTGAGLVFLGLSILTAVLMLVMAGRASATDLPANAETYLPTLKAEIAASWPSMPMPSVLASQIEQETCVSLKSPKCWSPTAELKTSREYGFGFFQHTRAYRADGSVRFDAWADARQAYGLKAWSWANRYDPAMQMRAGVLSNKSCFNRIGKLVPTDYNRLAMCDAAHNGGYGGLAQERRMCASADGCDPDVWFGNVELHSIKSRVKWKGYGESAYSINRGHVRNVMIVRRPKYAQWFGEA